MGGRFLCLQHVEEKRPARGVLPKTLLRTPQAVRRRVHPQFPSIARVTQTHTHTGTSAVNTNTYAVVVKAQGKLSAIVQPTAMQQ